MNSPEHHTNSCHTSGSRGIWISRLKYSMSEAFLKKFLRLDRRERQMGDERGCGRRKGTTAGLWLPAELLVEAVPVALQGVGRQTWVSRDSCDWSGLHICSHAPRTLHCKSQHSKSQEGVECEGSGWEGGVPIPRTGIRDVAQGDVSVGAPKYPHEAAGTVLPSNPMQGAGRPEHVGLN